MMYMDFNDLKKQSREPDDPSSKFSIDNHDLGIGGVNYKGQPEEDSAEKVKREQEAKDRAEKRFQLLRDLQREIKFGDKDWAKSKLQ